METEYCPVFSTVAKSYSDDSASSLCRIVVTLVCVLLTSQPGVAQDSQSSARGLEAMLLTSRAFREVAEKIRPSLVTIESLGGVGAVQGKIGGIRKQGEGNSTGVIVSADGFILTSTFNFIQQPPVITVITPDGERRVARLLGRDDIRKICLLKIDEVDNLPVPEFASLQSLQVGQWAVSVGVGYGDISPAISTGIISATNRIGGRAIQTDANISPANYGGPLLDIQGKIVGICVPLNPQSNAIGAGVEWYDSGIGFAIPVDGLNSIIERLKKGERIQPAFLGIQYVPNNRGDGLIIEQVVQGTPAEKAGLQIGDRIMAIDDQPTNDVLMMKQVLNQYEAGQKAKLSYIPYEKQDKIVVNIVLGVPPRPKGELVPLEPPKIR